jgi:nonsense-mediated mRNA decay protein 3
MKDKFCPKCGKEADRLFEGTCVDCFMKRKVAIKVPEEIAIKVCKYCGRYFLGNSIGGKAMDVIGQAVEKIFNVGKRNLKSLKYRIEDGKLRVSVKFDFGGLQKSEEHDIDIKEIPFVCQYCSMAETHYYNSIIQVRAPAEKMGKIMEDVRMIMGRHKADRLAFISEIKLVKYGADIYIGSKDAAWKVAKYLKKKFNAGIKYTKKVSGKKLGKTISKDTILIFIR